MTQVTRPPTPTEDDFKQLDEEVNAKQALFKNVPLVNYHSFHQGDPYEGLTFMSKLFRKIFKPLPIHPQSTQMTVIMGLQTLACLYNAWAVPFGFAFTFYRVTFSSHLKLYVHSTDKCTITTNCLRPQKSLEGQNKLPPLQIKKNIRFDFDDEIKIGDVRTDNNDLFWIADNS